MRHLIGILAAVLLFGCASSVGPTLRRTPNRENGPKPPLVVFVEANDLFVWDGWSAHEADLPSLVQQYRPNAIVLKAMKGSSVEFSDMLQIRGAIIAAGVSDVRVGSGGLGEK